MSGCFLIFIFWTSLAFQGIECMQVPLLLFAAEMEVITIVLSSIIQVALLAVVDLAEGEIWVDIETIRLLMVVGGMLVADFLGEVLMGLEWVLGHSEVKAYLEITLMSAQEKEIGCAQIPHATI